MKEQNGPMSVVDIHLIRGLVVALSQALVLIALPGYLAWSRGQVAAAASEALAETPATGSRQFYPMARNYHGDGADRTAGDCASPLPIACGQQVSGDTTGYTNNHDKYSCGYFNQTGPEVIYSFTLAAGSDYITATLSSMSAEVDLDVFLLQDCPAGECIADASYGDFTASASNVAPGTYYIAVDGWHSAAGSYDLELACASDGPHYDYKVYLPIVTRGHAAR